MRSKIEQYLLDYVEKELSAEEARSVAAEIKGSAKLKAEVADIQAVRAEIKNTQNTATRGVNFDQLHRKIMDKIMSQVENAKQ